MAGVAKIDELDRCVWELAVEDQIIWLDVSVDDAALV